MVWTLSNVVSHERQVWVLQTKVIALLNRINIWRPHDQTCRYKAYVAPTYAGIRTLNHHEERNDPYILGGHRGNSWIALLSRCKKRFARRLILPFGHRNFNTVSQSCLTLSIKNDPQKHLAANQHCNNFTLFPKISQQKNYFAAVQVLLFLIRLFCGRQFFSQIYEQ